MWAYFIHRMNARSVVEVRAAIERNAEIIRRPNSSHSYSHVVIKIFRYEGAKQIVGFRNRDYDDDPRAFWHKWQTEADVLALVHDRRRDSLFGSGSPPAPITPLGALFAELHARYASVHDREAERALLREAEARLPAVDETGHVRANLVPRWKWTKRHTTATSFPFIRPGIDVEKADGFDLGGDPSQPRWYALVSFHY